MTELTNSVVSEDKVALEVAENDLKRFAETMELDLDPSGMDDEDKKSLQDAKRKILKAITSGKLAINDNGEPVFLGSITFYEPTGSTLTSMDQRRKGHDIEKTITLLAAVTKKPASTFSQMPSRDFKVCQAIIGLFLG